MAGVACFPSRVQSRFDKWNVPAIEKIVPAIIKRYDVPRVGGLEDRGRIEPSQQDHPLLLISPNITPTCLSRRGAPFNLIVLL
ncbi:hypothetical protein WN55_01524 [Dufourea novaeangliae]|uniref:Uncharacterized protein n=1 Tax=Dufourea novaeangliae TaxID=178035 RepID=A0A154PG44_DUFNO|nr:hypothetical protein WN55_01524 [Dufourea novaeangliae]